MRSYLNERKLNSVYRTHVERFAYDKAKGISDKQYELYRKLCKFMDKKSIDYSFLKKPTNNEKMHNTISAMFTIIKRNNLYEEFFSQENEK